MSDIEAVKSKCQAWWNAHYPDSPPVGFVLRRIYRDRWLRFHSLPDSKRYPESAADYDQLLVRHNSVASDVLGNDASCFLIHGSSVDTAVDPGTGSLCWTINPEALNAGPNGLREDQVLQLEVKEIVWRPGEQDDLLRDVSEWKVSQVVFVSQRSGNVYAPYDGGADLVFQNTEERDESRARYALWLPISKDGL